MKQNTIGILLITKNEERHLANCLNSVADWADEIVIVDAGSTDLTEQIAKKYTDKFFTHADWRGFGKQRQIAQNYMTTDWVFAIDADEIVTEELQQSILQIVAQQLPDSPDSEKFTPQNSQLEQQATQLNCYQVNRLTKIFGKYIYHSGWYPDYVARLYPRSLTGYNDNLVHESLVIPANVSVKKLNGHLLHNTAENVAEYNKKMANYIALWTQQRQGKKSSSLLTALVHSFAIFFKMYLLKKGFLDGKHGLLLAIISANTTFTKYADLWISNATANQTKDSQAKDIQTKDSLNNKIDKASD